MEERYAELLLAMHRLSARQAGLELVVETAIGGMYVNGYLAPRFLEALRFASEVHHKRSGDIHAEEIAELVDRMVSVISGEEKKPARPILTVIQGGKPDDHAKPEECEG